MGGAGYPRFMHYKIRVSHVPPASRRGMVQHYTISWYQHYWLVVWNHGILWLSIGKSINIISWCSRWFSRTKPSARLRGYSPLLAVVEVCIQRRGRSKSWHAWGAAGAGLKTWSWPGRMRKRKSMNIRKKHINSPILPIYITVSHIYIYIYR